MTAIDCRSLQPSSSVIRLVGRAIWDRDDAHAIYRQLKTEISAGWPGAATIGRQIVEGVDRDGFAVADQLGLADLDPAIRDVLLLEVLSHVGKITVHDDHGKVLWDIKDRAKTIQRAPTFSERLGACPMHTDSAFTQDPERFLCLFVVRESGDGGGESVVIKIDNMLKQLSAEQDGSRCIEILKANNFPLRTPDAFSAVEQVLSAPLLGTEPMVRFRYDSVIEGFNAKPDLDSPERRWALEYFFEFAQMRAERMQVLAVRDQLAVVDNRNALHARTHYADPHRHLIRARLHPMEKAA
ncbi:MAG: TauD/TfdA family dioxygenase [Rhodospirillaceae bacterium]|nr:TauD/TfdA family dioxygenase [Rhodospirillales bacterium]